MQVPRVKLALGQGVRVRAPWAGKRSVGVRLGLGPPRHGEAHQTSERPALPDREPDQSGDGAAETACNPGGLCRDGPASRGFERSDIC